MVKGMEGKSYGEWWHMLNLWTLEERRNRQDLIEVFKICKGYTRINASNLFYFDNNRKGTRGHCFKLVKLRCTRDSREHFFQIGLWPDGTCWTKKQLMRPASMHLRGDWRSWETQGWAFSWISPLSPGPPGGYSCWWGLTRWVTRWEIRLVWLVSCVWEMTGPMKPMTK